MKTSLATLAATNSAHSSSTGLMTVNSASSSSPMANTSSSAVDINDSSVELRTEFYTREGLWKLVPNGDYVKHHQPPAAQPPTPSYPSSGSGALTSHGAGAGNTGTSSSSQASSSSNDLVKLSTFRFLKSYTFNVANNSLLLHSSSAKGRPATYLCESCYAKTTTADEQVRFRVNDGYDDDDDVVYNSEERLNDDGEDEDDGGETDEECRLCKSRGDLISEPGQVPSTEAAGICLDLVCFNFAREIYFYEFSPIQENLKSDVVKNLAHKKPYRTFMSSCFDVNETASVANSLELQMSTSMTLTPSSAGAQTKTLSLSESNLSLIVAAGFSKGEIHVFDCYKKEASVFYNNSKLVDKSKVTCIKWLPNSMNLFLVGYSSGSIYLYDANNQAQASLAPVFTKLVQNEAFAIYVNGSTSSPTLGSIGAGATAAANNNTIQSHQVHSKTAPVVSQIVSSSPPHNQSSGAQKKLVLLSSNQTPTQTAKNPLLKLTVGAPSASAASPSSGDAAAAASSSFPFFTDGMCSGANGVNELAFSPCGAYLAVVSQDGYLRVFTFVYKSNLQMQIELRCSMKSYFGGLLCVCWSPDAKYIVTGGEDDLVTVFSFVEMRVACRGRGHSSWVNSCAFDPWTTLTSTATADDRPGKSKQAGNTSSKNTGDEQQFYAHSDKEQDADSDLEDYHNQKLKNLQISAAKRRDLKDARLRKRSSKSTVFYRFASCGQDNQVCFWDLTEDILREKQPPPPQAQGSRSRAPAATQLPQIIIQPSALNAYEAHHPSSSSGSSTSTTTSSLEKHQTATQSLVSTAKHLFSLKHSESKANKMANDEDHQHQHHPVAKSATGFFKMRHKRNTSLNTNGEKAAASSSSKASSSSAKVTLNSYRKSPNPINSITDSSSSTAHTPLDSGVNSLVTPASSRSKVGAGATSPSRLTCAPFNLCPKLHEVPMIEPLICKRIAAERLTSIVFREDCFLVSSQDGIVQTWARPNRFSESASDTSLPNLSSNYNNNNKINSTSL